MFFMLMLMMMNGVVGGQLVDEVGGMGKLM